MIAKVSVNFFLLKKLMRIWPPAHLMESDGDVDYVVFNFEWTKCFKKLWQFWNIKHLEK